MGMDVSLGDIVTILVMVFGAGMSIASARRDIASIKDDQEKLKSTLNSKIDRTYILLDDKIKDQSKIVAQNRRSLGIIKRIFQKNGVDIDDIEEKAREQKLNKLQAEDEPGKSWVRKQ